MLMKTQHYSSSSLQQRVESLQHHIDILRSARKDALLSARDLRRANEKIDPRVPLCWLKKKKARLTLF